jgi:adenylosuccinate lyase
LANRRLILPGAFLACDELLHRAHRILQDLRIYDGTVERNLSTYGVFAATERLLMGLAQAGADRQAMHEVIRQHAMEAWHAVQQGQPNPLADHLAAESEVLRYLPADRVRGLLDAGGHIGDAPDRARQMAQKIRDDLFA